MKSYQHTVHRFSRTLALASAALMLSMTAFANVAQARDSDQPSAPDCTWECSAGQSL